MRIWNWMGDILLLLARLSVHEMRLSATTSVLIWPGGCYMSVEPQQGDMGAGTRSHFSDHAFSLNV